MKKIFILMPALIAWTASLSAQHITREQADAIALDYFEYEMAQSPQAYHLLVKVDTSEESLVMTTSKDETVKVKYACWVYHLYRTYKPGDPVPQPSPVWQHRYLLVKKENGHVLEIITRNDYPGPDISAWEPAGMPTGLDNPKENTNRLLYPNPVDDQLTFSCNEENTRVEIYDLKGTCHFSGTLSGKDTCRLNVSFLSAGVYTVNFSGEVYKIIKK